jgi:hypothetical protein
VCGVGAASGENIVAIPAGAFLEGYLSVVVLMLVSRFPCSNSLFVVPDAIVRLRKIRAKEFRLRLPNFRCPNSRLRLRELDLEMGP